MASRLVVALACFALCHSSPVLLNGYLYRDGRSYSMGQAYGGNRATGSASINGGVVQAYGSASNDNQYTRNGYGEAYPGQLVAQAEAYDNPHAPYGSAKAVAEAQNTPTFYAVPAPATIVSYEQNFEVPSQGSYQLQVPGAIAAESTAVINDNSESSVSSVRSDGTGSAQSSAQTNGMGSYGVTSTNANTFGAGFGSASSNANNAFGSTVTSAKTNGYGAAASKTQGEMGLTSAQSTSNGGYGSASSTVNNAQESAVATANTHGYGSASSNANINSVERAVVTSAKTNPHQPKGWRFGLLYDTPSQIRSVPSNGLSTAGVAKSTAQVNTGNYGTAQSTADAQGSGVVNAKADINGGYLHSVANPQNFGYETAKSTAHTHGYGSANSAADIGYGSIKSTANTQGAGYANANADLSGAGALKSSANSNGFGSAASSANTGPTFGTFKTYVPYSGTRSAVNAQTSGTGSANSSVRTQGIQTGYRVVNSSANSSGYGNARANAQTL